MVNIDFNLLIALEALLSERSVTGAARRLGLSVSAMSRTLTRLREATGDRLLLQAGRTLVLTPYAEQLNQQVPALSRDIQAVLRPTDRQCDPATLERSFTIRAGEGFVDLAGAALMKRIHNAAPRVQLNFVPKVDWDAQPLRDGAIDLEIGTVKTTAPEIRTRLLFRDRYIGVCRKGHPVLDAHAMDAATYAAADHVAASRPTPVDAALAALGLKRKIMMTVAGYTHAMQVARHSDLLAIIPHSCLGNAFIPDHAAANGLQSFELPVQTPAFNVSAIWHPRLDRDPAHVWLRNEILALCQTGYP
ncbi:LysR family transcriptional regulator [Duganella dendranthematis]|uniref:LysR family transcriptional regulator n=1 Tax=Duganella dendranthematis TaxID=2728021 RepID=A0ABX6MG09_9BURK|nr:LysR substrate-binding domain-containing protein [Duganella dendranthematis]QJD93276.1 LysR family transcriptional regulator [Duganella dendranthematis]